MKKIFKLFYFIIYFLPPFIITGIYAIFNSWVFSELIFLLSIITGIAPFFWLFNQFILSSRPKFIEVHFGLDKLFLFHGYMAIISIVTANIHLNLKKIYYQTSLQMTLGEIANYIFITVILVSVFLFINTIVLKIKLFAVIKNFVNKKLNINYQILKLFHNITIIAAIILFIHVLLSQTVQSGNILKYSIIIYFIIGISFYIYFKFIKKNNYFNKKLSIDDVIKESSKITTVKIDKNFKFNYNPGQFSFIKILSKNIQSEEHPFTISSCPDDKFISFSIKNLGDWTSKISAVNKNDKIILDGPYGNFSYKMIKTEDRLVFIAGGIGITPFLSMIKSLSVNYKNKKADLIWFVSDNNDLFKLDLFDQIKTEMSNFNYITIIKDNKQAKTDKFTIDKIKEFLKAAALDNISFFICGPPGMMDYYIKQLKNEKVKSKMIHFEKFSL